MTSHWYGTGITLGRAIARFAYILLKWRSKIEQAGHLGARVTKMAHALPTACAKTILSARCYFYTHKFPDVFLNVFRKSS